MKEFRDTIIVCGRYGAGKTNLSVALALWAAEGGAQVTVADLDLVNPYFRTADFDKFFQEKGIRLIAPRYANTNLDIPVVPSALAAAIGRPGQTLIIDVGGDDDGAVALGGYAHLLEKSGYTMLYVVNALREPDPDPQDEVSLLKAIEKSARLRVTGLVNNTNLGPETTGEVIASSREYVDSVAQTTGLPVLFTASSVDGLKAAEDIFRLKVYVKPPWEE